MGRKVFISFLGNGFYEPTRYVESEEDESSATQIRFFQEASIIKFCKEYTSKDVIYIFTTTGALTNWKDGEHKNIKSNSIEWYEGLHARLKGLSLDCTFENVMIPDGQSTDEIWEIFRIVYEKLETNDELLFDITHGFRSLPMLNMVLINYAKLLKNIHVKGIYYGAFEAKYTKENRSFSPIWNLKSFEELQEWTNNVNFLLNGGNALPLVKQIEDQYPQIKSLIEQYSKSILTNRGKDLFDGVHTTELHNNLENFRNSGAQLSGPLEPIFSKIRNEFSQYKKDSSINGFLAVRWCIKYGLIPQAGTLFTEFIISFVMEIAEEKKNLFSYEHRHIVSYFLQVMDSSVEISKKIEEQWQQEMLTKVNAIPSIDVLKTNYSKIAKQLRNDLNHAGFREDPKEYEEFERLLKDSYMVMKSYLKQHFKVSIPKI